MSERPEDFYRTEEDFTPREVGIMRMVAVLWRHRDAALDNLAAVQARCTELLEEHRSLRARVAELEAYAQVQLQVAMDEIELREKVEDEREELREYAMELESRLGVAAALTAEAEKLGMYR